MSKTDYSITIDNYYKLFNTFFAPAPKKMTGNLEKVVFNGPATVIFEKGKKTVVKRMENDKPSKYKGFVMCLCKHLIGSTEWNHLVRPHSSKPNMELAIAEALCEHILGREKFKNLVKEYVD